MKRTVIILSVMLCILCLAQYSSDNDRLLRMSFTISSDGKRFAYFKSDQDILSIVIDGTSQTLYSKVWDRSIVFSSDGKRVAYRIDREGKSHWIIDGIEQKGFDTLSEEYEPEKISYSSKRLIFTPDGKNYAYLAKENGKYFVVTDQIEGKKYDHIDDILFSPDGKKLAYVATTDDSQFLVLDGKENKHYRLVQRPEFCSDSKRIAYFAVPNNNNDMLFILDDKQAKYNCVPTYLQPDRIFAATNNSYAYKATLKGGKRFYVVTGKAEKPYRDVGEFFFGPDGKRYAYGASNYHGECIVVDGNEKQISQVKVLDIESITFSQDCKRIAYICNTYDDERVVIVDGKIERRFPRTEMIKKVLFSPDSKQTAYAVTKKNSAFVVHNGNDLQEYEQVENITFSSDNQLVYCIKSGGPARLVGDKWVFPKGSSPTIFRGNDGVSWITEPEGWSVVINGEKIGKYERILDYRMKDKGIAMVVKEENGTIRKVKLSLP